MFIIYRIITSTTPDNSYKINRDEDWKIVLVFETDDLTKAEEYIIDNSLKYTDLPLFIHNLSDDKKLEFTNQFCFTNDVYLKYRRFFIGYPDVKQLKNALIKDGIKIR